MKILKENLKDKFILGFDKGVLVSETKDGSKNSGYIYFSEGRDDPECSHNIKEDIIIGKKYNNSINGCKFEEPVKISHIEVSPRYSSYYYNGEAYNITLSFDFFDNTDDIILTVNVPALDRSKTEMEFEKLSDLYWINVFWLSSGGWIDDCCTNIGCKEYKYFTCKKCGKRFGITSGETDWFIDRGMKLPKTCSTCRKTKV